MAARYWVGGTGNWNDTSSWAATSGGAGGETVPTNADDVIIDANSFAASGTITVNTTGDAPCLSFDASALDETVTIQAGASQHIDCFGDVELSLLLTRSIRFDMVGTGTMNWTSNGATQTAGDLSCEAGTVVLQDSLITSTGGFNAYLRLSGGDLDTNRQYVRVRSVAGTGSGGTVYLRDSTIVCDEQWASNQHEIVPGDSHIIVGEVGCDFWTQGSAKNFNEVTLKCSQRFGNTTEIVGDNIFKILRLEAGTGGGIQDKELRIVGGTTQTIREGLIHNGNATESFEITSTNTTPFTLDIKTPELYSDYLDLSYCTQSGGTFYAGSNSTNSGNNTGVSFTDPSNFFPQFQDIYDAWVTKQTYRVCRAAQRLVMRLVDRGLWYDMGCLMNAAIDADYNDDSHLWWNDVSRSGNNPSTDNEFEPRSGWWGYAGGASFGIRTDYNLVDEGTPQNTVTFGGRFTGNKTTSSPAIGGGNNFLLTIDNGGFTYYRLNQSSWSSYSANDVESGTYICTRRGASDVEAYYEGESVDAETDASTTPTNNDVVLVGGASDRLYSWFFILHRGVSDSEAAFLDEVFRDYMYEIDSPVQYEYEYQAVLDEMTSLPPVTERKVQNQMVKWLKDWQGEDFWSRSEQLLFLAQATVAADAEINMVDPGSFDGTINSALTFTPNRGVTGNDTSNDINSNLTPSTDLSVASENDVSFLAYIRNNSQENSPVVAAFGSSSRNWSIVPRFSTDVFLARINTNLTHSGSSTDSRGCWLVSRTASNLTTTYKNGSSVGSGVQPSLGLPNTYPELLNSTPYEMAIYIVIDGVTANEAASLFTIFETTLAGIGAAVVKPELIAGEADAGIVSTATLTLASPAEDLEGDCEIEIESSGTLTITNSIEGDSELEIESSGTLTQLFNGSIEGNSDIAISTSGTLDLIQSIAGDSEVEIQTAGTLTQTESIEGNCDIEIESQGTLVVTNSIEGDSELEIQTSGTLDLIQGIEGDCEIEIQTSGTLIQLLPDALIGDCEVEIQTSGTLTMTTSIEGDSELEIAAAGTLTMRQSIAGGATVEITAGGALFQRFQIEGDSEIEIESSGTLTQSSSLAGNAEIAIQTLGTLILRQAMFGNTDIEIRVNGALEGAEAFNDVTICGEVKSGSIQGVVKSKTINVNI